MVDAAGRAATLCVPAAPPDCLDLALADFRRDLAAVANAEPVITTTLRTDVDPARPCVVVGVLGNHPVIDGLVADGLVDVDGLMNRWEGFVIQTVAPQAGKCPPLLVVVGADPHGTMYGLYTISEEILGIDPLYLWTGSRPSRRERIVLAPCRLLDAPGFRYRGLFINDEDLLMGWLGPEQDRVVEHEAYEQIIETILRLKGNLLAPAMIAEPMTERTLRFTHARGLYYTASHLESLLANPQFWNQWCAANLGRAVEYSFVQRREYLEQFWRDSIRRHKPFANLWPVGLRGVTDLPLWHFDPWAPQEADDRARLIAEAINAQLRLLQDELGPTALTAVTTFTPWDEVLPLFNTGYLEVPDEVMFIWPSDRQGGLRQYPTPEQARRTGGNGAYYHVQYGTDQLVEFVHPDWIADTFVQMARSGIRDYFLVNVGDLRETVIGATAAMELAWRPGRADAAHYGHDFLERWAARHFGSAAAASVAELYERRYPLEARTTIVHGQRVVNLDLGSSGVNLATRQRVQKALDFADQYGDPSLAFDAEAIRRRQALLDVHDAWNQLYRDALQVRDQLPVTSQRFYDDNLMLQVQIPRLLNHWALGVLDALDAWSIDQADTAIAALDRARTALAQLEHEMQRAQWGKFHNWYRNAYQPGDHKFRWVLRPEYDRAQLDKLQTLATTSRSVKPLAAAATMADFATSFTDRLLPETLALSDSVSPFAMRLAWASSPFYLPDPLMSPPARCWDDQWQRDAFDPNAPDLVHQEYLAAAIPRFDHFCRIMAQLGCTGVILGEAAFVVDFDSLDDANDTMGSPPGSPWRLRHETMRSYLRQRCAVTRRHGLAFYLYSTGLVVTPELAGRLDAPSSDRDQRLRQAWQALFDEAVSALPDAAGIVLDFNPTPVPPGYRRLLPTDSAATRPAEDNPPDAWLEIAWKRVTLAHHRQLLWRQAGGNDLFTTSAAAPVAEQAFSTRPHRRLPALAARPVRQGMGFFPSVPNADDVKAIRAASQAPEVLGYWLWPNEGGSAPAAPPGTVTPQAYLQGFAAWQEANVYLLAALAHNPNRDPQQLLLTWSRATYGDLAAGVVTDLMMAGDAILRDSLGLLAQADNHLSPLQVSGFSLHGIPPDAIADPDQVAAALPALRERLTVTHRLAAHHLEQFEAVYAGVGDPQLAQATRRSLRQQATLMEVLSESLAVYAAHLADTAAPKHAATLERILSRYERQLGLYDTTSIRRALDLGPGPGTRPVDAAASGESSCRP